MLERNHSQDRCILFPQSQGAVDCIESNELDKRYEIEIIDFSYSQMSKLDLFGFFTFSDFRIKQNSFVKLSSGDIEKVKYLHDVYIAGEIVEKSQGLKLHTKGGNLHDLKAQGWQHFQ